VAVTGKAKKKKIRSDNKAAGEYQPSLFVQG
jgi:hypothetical protein